MACQRRYDPHLLIGDGNQGPAEVTKLLDLGRKFADRLDKAWRLGSRGSLQTVPFFTDIYIFLLDNIFHGYPQISTKRDFEAYK
ncbi:MAG: hypothetical protein PHZ02_07995 [Desulfocapsaceae bacterium]|nr:hypothetical protein [Desulfocapsaceae bacterium]